MQKNWSKPVKTGYLRQLNRLGPVLIGSVAVSPKMRNRNRSCGCWLPILGPKNRTEPDLQTLYVLGDQLQKENSKVKLCKACKV